MPTPLNSNGAEFQTAPGPETSRSSETAPGSKRREVPYVVKRR